MNELPDIAHAMLDLLIGAMQNLTMNTSPRTPSSPSTHPSPRTNHMSNSTMPAPAPYSTDQLMRLKIAMRETEHQPRLRQVQVDEVDNLRVQERSAGLGRNEGTVRFLFGPTTPQHQNCGPGSIRNFALT